MQEMTSRSRTPLTVVVLSQYEDDYSTVLMSVPHCTRTVSLSAAPWLLGYALGGYPASRQGRGGGRGQTGHWDEVELSTRFHT